MAQRYWLVWVDYEPFNPEQPLGSDEAAAEFAGQVTANDTTVEIRQCSDEDLEWAGIEIEPDPEDPEARSQGED
jgi:hypothetical protein